MIKHINKNNFNDEVLNSKKVVLVDFFATWCGPCQKLSPVLEKISNSRAEIDIAKVDIDKSMELASKYKIEVVPTMIIFKDGKAVKQVEGFYNEDEIMSFIEEYI